MNIERKVRFESENRIDLRFHLPFKRIEGEGQMIQLDDKEVVFITRSQPLPLGALALVEFERGQRNDIGRVVECSGLPEEERTLVTVRFSDQVAPLDIELASDSEGLPVGDPRLAKIVVVDDDEDIANILALCLREIPCATVEILHDGESALNHIQQTPPHLAILDIHLPGLSGVEIMETIRERSSFIEVIVITGTASVESAVAAVRSGAFDYLTKPFESLSKIREVAQHALEHRRLRIQNRRLLEDLKKANQTLAVSSRALRASHQMMLQQEKVAALGRLASGVAHEINNPLGAIVANMGVLEEILENHPDQAWLKAEGVRQTLGDVSTSARRIHQVVNDLRTFAGPTSMARSLSPVKDLVDLVTRINRPSINERAQLQLQLSSKTLINVHQGAMGRALTSIVMNGLQAFGSRPTSQNRLKISAWEEGEWCRIDVEDNGEGIRPEHLNRIWDPFFTTRQVGSGIGLGLSVARSIIREHGGTLEAISVEGKGTTMTIRLPLVIEG